jgi:hypothetical protein
MTKILYDDELRMRIYRKEFKGICHTAGNPLNVPGSSGLNRRIRKPAFDLRDPATVKHL